MAKQTGQITVLKNNKVTNVEHQIRFIFTKNNGERITRDTTNKGVINFDIPNGDWNVSWFAVDGDQKVLPLRAGLQLKITSSTPTTALADWIYGDNTHVADPILTQWTTVLDEMKSVRDEFRRENSFVGTGKIMKEGASLSTSLLQTGPYIWEHGTADTWKRGQYGLTPAGKFGLRWVYTQAVYRDEDHADGFSDVQIGLPYSGGLSITYRVNHVSKGWGNWHETYGTSNTTIDSNGFLKAASPIIRLFNDHIETNGQFKEEPIFEKIGIGTYKISNTLGLAKEGWYIETPRDRNGFPYFLVEWEQDENSVVTIRTFKRKIDLETLDFVNGEPVDIGEDQRWIDLRFHEEPEEVEEVEEESDLEKHLEKWNAVLL